MQRALAMQEKQAMRLRQREAAVTGPKDDLVGGRWSRIAWWQMARDTVVGCC